MKELTFKDVVEAVEGDQVLNFADLPVKRISIDSRNIHPGDTFIAVKGNNFDGHDFISEALSKGASLVIAERMPPSSINTSGKTFIVVPDSIKAMAKVAAKIRISCGIPVVCVTGTNGKTTVKDMTAAILSSRYNVLKSKASYNNIFGVCLTLFDLQSSHQAAVLEIGTNNFGEIADLSRIAAPDSVVITNIGYGHLEAFRDRKGVFTEKISILSGLSQGALAVLNGDDDMLSAVRSKNCRILFFGTGCNCDVRITGIKDSTPGTEFCIDGEKFLFPAAGRHNVYNAAAAIIVAKNMGIEIGEIREKMEKMVLPSMRLEKIDSGGITFLNDAYNANPSSFAAAVETLASLSSPGKEKWVVAGDMLELGGVSREMHRELGKKIASVKLDFLITLGDMGREVLEGARSSGMDADRTYAAISHDDAAAKISERASSGTTVLVKGSRLMKMEEVIKCFITCCTR